MPHNFLVFWLYHIKLNPDFIFEVIKILETQALNWCFRSWKGHMITLSSWEQMKFHMYLLFDLSTLYLRIYYLFSFSLYRYIQILLKSHSWRCKATSLLQLKVRTEYMCITQNCQKGVTLNIKNLLLSLTMTLFLLGSNQANTILK